MEFMVVSVLNGISYGLLLFMLSSGLTLIFSMMGVLNFAHASLYMLGAYMAFTLGQHTGFWPALFLAPVILGLIGALIERFGLRLVHKHGHVAELLFTFGLAFVIEELVKVIWGVSPLAYRAPAELEGPLFTLYGGFFPKYRGFIVLVSLVMLLLLWLALTKTRIGLTIQAALTHPHMVEALGHDVPTLFMLVFGVGAALAAMAGVVGGPAFVTDSSMAAAMGPIVFVVVVLGGMGSLAGAFLASLLIGVVQTFAVTVDGSIASTLGLLGLQIGPQMPLYELLALPLSQIAPLLPYLLMVLMLIFRPRGLMGARET